MCKFDRFYRFLFLILLTLVFAQTISLWICGREIENLNSKLEKLEGNTFSQTELTSKITATRQLAEAVAEQANNSIALTRTVHDQLMAVLTELHK